MVAAPRKAGRWAINKLDQDRLEAVMLASEWGKDLVPKDVSAEAAVQKLVRTVTAACDATIPCQHPPKKTGNVYCWMEEIARLKSKANQSRR